MFLVVGGLTIFIGYQSLQDAKQADESWEQVTLPQWLAGDTENSTLFEISEFQAGEQFWALLDRSTNDFSMVYIPLYKIGQAEDDGAGVQVVAGISDVKNEQELEAVFDADTIKIQAYGNQAPLYAKNLSEAYPKIDWDTVHWVTIDENVATLESAWQFLLGGVVSVFAGSGLAWILGFALVATSLRKTRKLRCFGCQSRNQGCKFRKTQRTKINYFVGPVV